jgi:hypothetical protein
MADAEFPLVHAVAEFQELGDAGVPVAVYSLGVRDGASYCHRAVLGDIVWNEEDHVELLAAAEDVGYFCFILGLVYVKTRREVGEGEGWKYQRVRQAPSNNSPADPPPSPAALGPSASPPYSAEADTPDPPSAWEGPFSRLACTRASLSESRPRRLLGPHEHTRRSITLPCKCLPRTRDRLPARRNGSRPPEMLRGRASSGAGSRGGNPRMVRHGVWRRRGNRGKRGDGLSS